MVVVCVCTKRDAWLWSVCVPGILYDCGLCRYQVYCMVVVCICTRCGVCFWSVYVLGVVYGCGLCMC